MAEDAGFEPPFHPDAPAGAVNARTLVAIRWVAIAGQAAALLVVEYGLGFPLPLGACLAIVGAAAALNLAMQARARASPRLSDRAAALSLAWDIAQSTALLYATGGMENPFALLLLAPVTVSATVLSPRATVGLCLLALAGAALLRFVHMPLPWEEAGFAPPPLYLDGVWAALSIAIVFIAGYAWRMAEEARRMSDALAAARTALAREQRVSALGGLAAAAAHELGSPLGTIAVIAADLARDIPEDSAFAEDARLLRGEAERCRRILADLSDRPEIGGGDPYALVPFGALVELAAAPHRGEPVELVLERRGPGAGDAGDGDAGEPTVFRSPEILHGVGALIQNAAQYARATVEISAVWDPREVAVAIEDDGPGFAPAVLDRLGEPWLSTRRGEAGHMGLGVFIARTLLERTGGRLSFSNRPEGGARAEARWRRADIERGPAGP